MKKILSKNLKDMKAITLIALIVTIIVLIIITGVSVSLILGNNGIINKSQEGRNNYAVGANEEQYQMGKVDSEFNDYVAGSREQIMVDKDEYNNLKNTVSTMQETINTLQSRVNDLGNLSDKIVTQKFSLDNKSISATSGISYEIPITKEGYTPLTWDVSIVNATSSGVNSSRCVPYLQQLTNNGTTFYGWVMNYASSAAKIKIEVTVLFIKNDANL